MQKNHRIRYLVLPMALVMSIFSFAKSDSAVIITLSKTQRKSAVEEQKLKYEKTFPVVDYYEVEPSEDDKGKARKQKQIRHNKADFVAREVHPEDYAIVAIPEWQFDFPALPVVKSDVVVLGKILDAQAHLSEDKTDVYSEFTVQVETVFKTLKSNTLTAGSQMIVERTGGFVRYPNGQKVLYELAQNGMPRVGGRYVFFLVLRARGEDLSILTAYELGDKGVSPLDGSAQFKAFQGYDESSFLSALRESLTSLP